MKPVHNVCIISLFHRLEQVSFLLSGWKTQALFVQLGHIHLYWAPRKTSTLECLCYWHYCNWLQWKKVMFYVLPPTHIHTLPPLLSSANMRTITHLVIVNHLPFIISWYALIMITPRNTRLCWDKNRRIYSFIICFHQLRPSVIVDCYMEANRKWLP